MSTYACFLRCDFRSGKHTNKVNILKHTRVCVYLMRSADSQCAICH